MGRGKCQLFIPQRAPSTPFLCAQDRPFDSVSSALRTGPSTPLCCAQDRPCRLLLCCAQDRHFDSALLRSGQALRLRSAAHRMRVGPFDAAQDSFACWGGKNNWTGGTKTKRPCPPVVSNGVPNARHLGSLSRGVNSASGGARGELVDS